MEIPEYTQPSFPASEGVDSLTELAARKIYDNPQIIDRGKDEHLIKTIWAHLYDLRNRQTSDMKKYKHMYDNLPSMRRSDRAAFFVNVEDGFLPLTHELYYYMRILNLLKPEWPTRIINETDWNTSSFYRRAQTRNISRIFEFTGFNNLPPTARILYPDYNYKMFQNAFHVLMVPRGGSTIDRSTTFDCKLMLLFVTSVFVEEFYIDDPNVSDEIQFEIEEFRIKGHPLRLNANDNRFVIDRTRVIEYVYKSNFDGTSLKNRIQRSMDSQETIRNLYGEKVFDAMFSTPGWYMNEITEANVLHGPIEPNENLEERGRRREPIPPNRGNRNRFQEDEDRWPPNRPLETAIETRSPVRCKLPYDMYAFKFTVLDDEDTLRWLYFLLRFQHKWRKTQMGSLLSDPNWSTPVKAWSGMLGPYYDASSHAFYGTRTNDPRFVDKSTATVMNVRERIGVIRGRQEQDNEDTDAGPPYQKRMRSTPNDSSSMGETSMHISGNYQLGRSSRAQRLATGSYKNDCEHSCVLL